MRAVHTFRPAPIPVEYSRREQEGHSRAVVAVRALGLGLAAILCILIGCSSEKPKSATSDASVSGTSTSTETESLTGTATETSTSPTSVADSGPLLFGTPCNGHDEYCSKRYDELCQAATHDSVANSPDFWQVPAQSKSVREQLNASIGALMLSVYDDSGTLSVCRGDCDEGNTALASVLGSVRDFLDANPRQVVTLLLDSSVEASRVQREFEALELDHFAIAQAENAPWPTLGQMIESGSRLVVFSNAPDATAAWLLPRDVWIWETARDWTSLTSMKCNPAVGDRTRPLALIHHNLVDTADGGSHDPSVVLATTANAFAVVTERLEACASQSSRVPNFVAVDFAAVGDVVGATQVMNGVRPAP